MNLFFTYSIAVILVMLATPGIAAFDCTGYGASIRIDNDSALTMGGGTDRFYSSGFEAAIQCLRPEYYPTGIAANSLQWLNPAGAVTRQSIGIVAGQKLYTSSDISLRPSEIDTNSDRPYAAWAYVGLDFEAFGEDDAYLRHRFTLGCVGPCAQGEEVQTDWHEFFGFREPRGWNLQIEDQVAAQYFFEYRPPQHYQWQWFSVQPEFKASLGTIQNNLSIGGEVRAGDINLSDQTRAYFFVHNQAKAVLYDATLEGSLFDNDSPHTVEPTRFVIEQGLGVRFDWRLYKFEYRFVTSSTQVEEQDWKLWDHTYGSFHVGVPF